MAVGSSNDVAKRFKTRQEIGEEPFGICDNESRLVHHPHHGEQGRIYYNLNNRDIDSLETLKGPAKFPPRYSYAQPFYWLVYSDETGGSREKPFGYTIDQGIKAQAEIYGWRVEEAEQRVAEDDMFTRHMRNVQSWIRPIFCRWTTFELYKTMRLRYEAETNDGKSPKWMGLEPDDDDYFARWSQD